MTLLILDPKPAAPDSSNQANPDPHANGYRGIPAYLRDFYAWAYIKPGAVRLFEHQSIINLILFGNYARLRQAALDALGTTVSGRALQVACAYGDLTESLQRRLNPDATLDVVDIVPIQLESLARHLKPDARITLRQADSTSLPYVHAHFDQVLLYFLLHEQPDEVRHQTLVEALRVLKPGGQLVIVDYARPSWWHPLRPLMALVFAWLEPFAQRFCELGLESFLPNHGQFELRHRSCFFGGLYQLWVLTRTTPPVTKALKA